MIPKGKHWPCSVRLCEAMREIFPWKSALHNGWLPILSIFLQSCFASLGRRGILEIQTTSQGNVRSKVRVLIEVLIKAPTIRHFLKSLHNEVPGVSGRVEQAHENVDDVTLRET